ncbi:MAG: ABC transporter permease [Methanobacteriota archaeon]
MGNLWFRMLARRSRRATWTIVGLALCAMYLTGTISLVGGLHETTRGISNSFQQGPIIIYKGDRLIDSRIDSSAIDREGFECAKVTLAEVEIGMEGVAGLMRTYSGSLDDPTNILGMTNANLPQGHAFIGKSFSDRFSELGMELFVGSVLQLDGISGSVQVSVDAIYPSTTMLPSDWILIELTDILILDKASADNCSFVVLNEGDEHARAVLESRGLTSQNSMAVISFFEKGIYQIEGALWGLIAITSVIVALLVYSTLSIEVGVRKPDIRLLKKVGAGPGTIAAIFVGRGSYLALCGAAVGVACGYLAANLLISLASMRGLTTLIVPRADAFSMLVPLVIVLLAGLAGALIPSVSAARESMGGGAE